MTFSAMTDQAYELISERLVPKIMALQAGFSREQEQLRQTLENPPDQLQQAKVLQQRQNAAVAAMVADLFKKELSAITPEAALWFKGEAKPAGHATWIISPYEFDLMGQAMLSLAFEQEQKLVSGILCKLSTGELITGVEGEGAQLYGQALRVSARALSEKSYGMQFDLGVVHAPAYKKTVLAFRQAFRYKVMVNKVAENLSHFMSLVAKGEVDFVIATGFDYTDVAAAICLVEQAGGIVSDFAGTPERLLTGDSLFCGNSLIHRQFMEISGSLNGSQT